MKNEFHYKYRMIKSSWGIAIDLKGHITDRIDYSFSSDVDMTDQTCILKGIHFFHEHIYAHRKMDYGITFEKIYYNPCDFQNEGLIVATMEYLSQISGIPLPKIDMRFDRLMNQYHFQYGNVEIKS